MAVQDPGSAAGADSAPGMSAALQQALQPWTRFMENLPVGLYVCDRDGVVVRYNRRAAELWGRAPELGDPQVRFWGACRAYEPGGNPLDPADAPMCEVLRTGKPVRDRELLIERADGSRLHILANLEPLLGAGGEIVGGVNCFQDITELKRTQQLLDERERYYRDLLDALPAAIYTTDAAGRISFYNKAAVALAGRRPTLGRDEWCVTWRLFHPDGTPLPHDECPMAVALKENRPVYGAEALAERPEGGRVPFQPYPTPLRDASGALVGAVNMLVDISERKKAERDRQQLLSELRRLNQGLGQQVAERTRELTASRARLQAFFDNSPDWITLCRATADGRFIYEDMNPATELAYGMRRDQVIGRPVEDIIGADQAELPLHHFRECLRTGTRQRYVVRRQMAGRRRTIDVMLVPVPVEDEAGDRYIIATARDLTEREALEEALHHAQKIEAVGQLTGGIAHDFNNLLTAILGGIDLIESKTADQNILRPAATAMRAAQRGAELTSQLLAFSRKQRLEPKPTNINELVTGMGDMLLRTLGGTIRVELALGDGLWPALIDPNQIESAVLNLAINARDAMPDGGTLTLETANMRVGQLHRPADLAAGDYVMIAVMDTGQGMSEAVRARAFDPFFTTKEIGRGSGLGLSQVYGVCRQSGGAAEIESEPGGGTIIRVYLPRAPQTALPLLAERRSRPDAAAPRRERVLLVDDDENVRETVIASLRHFGYEVEPANSAGAAMAALSGARFDLVLMDFAMPGINGAEAGRAIRARWPGLPILFITGYADPTALDSIGEDAILRKPFLSTELDAKIRRVLDQSAGRRAPNVVPLRSEAG